MTDEDVSKIIAEEIAGVSEAWFTNPRNNPHGLDLSRCLLKPVLVKCRNAFPKFRNGKSFDAWVVLEELPNSEGGYLIIFDEETREFGLACGTRNNPVTIGFYGSFPNTVQGM